MMGQPEEKIRVLLVDDIPETRENLRKLLYFERDIEVAGVATNGEEAVKMAKELLPDVVLMDINMPGMDGIAATEAIARSVPTAQIIMMSVQGETEYLRRSMLAGAKGFLIKPFSSDEMVTTIRRAYSLRPKVVIPPSMPQMPAGVAAAPMPSPKAADQGKVIAVFSPKGGVGCSTLAVNLAIALRTAAGIQSPTEKRVALVDCSLQFGDVGVLLNLSSDHTAAELADKKGQMDNELLDVILTPHVSGVKVLLAPLRPEEAELLTAEHVSEMLAVLRRSFDYIVADTSSSLHDLTLSVLDAADVILLVLTPDIPAVKDAKLFLELAEALGYPQGKVKLILNKADRQSAVGPEEIAVGIKHQVLISVPSDLRAAYTAANQGVPCILSNRNSPIAQAALKLAQALVRELEAAKEGVRKVAEPQKEPKGALARLWSH